MRAQFWSFDIIFAIVIFSVALTLLVYTWYNVNSQLSLMYGNGGTIMQLELQSLSRSILSQGSPSYWNSMVNTANSSTWSGISVGLASGPHTTELSQGKLYTLMAMASNSTGYQNTKQVLGVGYDYFITIRGGGLNVSIGENQATHGALTTYVNSEQAFIGSTPVSIEVEVWTNQPFGVE